MPDQHERTPDTAATTTDDLGRSVAPSRRAIVDGGSHGWSPDDLVTEHLWLVDRLAANAARRYPAHTDRHELWSAGVLGLVKASRRYDPTEGVPFAAFASARVRGQIIDQVRSRDLASRRLRRILRVVVRASEFLAQHLGRAPSLEEISQASGMPIEMVRGALEDLAMLTDPTSIDEAGLIDTGLASRDADPGDQLAEAELLGAVREAVDRLPEPLRSIVMRSYWEGARLQDIAADMGITFQRVAQYRAEALAALEAWFAHLYDEVRGPDEHGPGRARRLAFCSAMASHSTWRARLAAGQGSPLEDALREVAEGTFPQLPPASGDEDPRVIGVDGAERTAALRYGIDRRALGARLRSRVQCVLSADEATFAFLDRQRAARHGRLRWAAHGVLRGCCSDFTVNGLLGTYRLHLLSTSQWLGLLGPGTHGRLLDVGAGVGGVTRQMAPCFDEVTAVETSASLVRRLRDEGFAAVRADLTVAPVPGGPYDAVALLNVLDRCARPRTLAANLVAALAPGGRLLVAAPLPYRPLWYSGPRTSDPVERLPLGRGSWEEQATLLVERVLEPLGLELEVLSRAPYLSEGDRHTPFYELDAFVAVLRRRA